MLKKLLNLFSVSIDPESDNKTANLATAGFATKEEALASAKREIDSFWLAKQKEGGKNNA